MKELVKPSKLEEQYEEVISYCEDNNRCSWGGCNKAPHEDEDILF